mgnify:CR=1 FL=1
MVGENPGFTAFRIGDFRSRLLNRVTTILQPAGISTSGDKNSFTVWATAATGSPELEVKVSKDNLQADPEEAAFLQSQSGVWLDR